MRLYIPAVLLFVLFSLFSFSSPAQSEDLIIQNFMFDTRGGFARMGLPTFVQGSTARTETGETFFLQEDWTEATILTLQNEKVSTQARYDVRKDQVLLLSAGEERMLFPQKVKAIAIGDLLLVSEVVFMKETGKMEQHWFELLVNGPMQLLYRYKLEKRKTDYHPGLLRASNYEWTLKHDYYYSNGAEAAKPMKLAKRKVLKLFGSRAPKVEAFIKENHLRTRDREHLAAIFRFYNSLLDIKQG